MDSALRDGDCLLLHRLVQRDLIEVVHLIEPVNAAHASVRKHQHASLDVEIGASTSFSTAAVRPAVQLALPLV